MKRKPIAVLLLLLLPIMTDCEKDQGTQEPLTITDFDGNRYKTVQIGDQLWMAENLKTTKYNDGKAIPWVTDNEIWNNLNTPAYCWYNNDETTYKNTYGALYNWYAVNTDKLCPMGWHVPTNNEWSTLIDYLGDVRNAGGKLKETGTIHWNSPNTGADNETGFTALPGGSRDDGGTFYGMGDIGLWWSSTEFETNELGAWGSDVDFGTSGVYIYGNGKYRGRSVRCIKD
ncbi:MAG: fibrobacter succinogenes major paralogous domain-containing protein [Maribacter sp.]|uniref:fibrobacter succinogenes major paralogous domain-containing protein n=1 Tax=Maribacter sp. TaxID=1897614 RepID=UPI003C70B37A